LYAFTIGLLFPLICGSLEKLLSRVAFSLFQKSWFLGHYCICFRKQRIDFILGQNSRERNRAFYNEVSIDCSEKRTEKNKQEKKSAPTLKKSTPKANIKFKII
jgi:hypothetical protein